ncbi:hypothetical protein PF0244 [Pyrococcus furiosus DSM 3638]|uniref:Uncharacterized protein n=1 Tax=Pyrococcus furiosus (strain ATCC 43587 / DSM 3638 / JCM 8422 / Vc1) TaxID=186497 RepID=Q8U451_PYRFU|nr:hypothetical protein PF0244 [Pyrococcus furiosus DSM 3638]
MEQFSRDIKALILQVSQHASMVDQWNWTWPTWHAMITDYHPAMSWLMPLEPLIIFFYLRYRDYTKQLLAIQLKKSNKAEISIKL